MRDHHIKKLALFMAVNLLFLSCKSTSTEAQKQEKASQMAALEETVQEIKTRIATLEQENSDSKKLVASLETDLLSQKEVLSTEKMNIAILKRGLRSGIFEELPEDKKNKDLTNATTTMLPDFVPGRSGFTEATGTMDTSPEKGSKNQDSITGPKELLAKSEIKIQKSQFKEALSDLNELKKKFPNFDDNGRSFLLAAECWLKLKEYDNVTPEIRNFYLKYPTSADVAYAKLLEAQADEGNGFFEKAATHYNEVISLSPQSSLAQSARNGMLRMHEQK